MGHGSAPFPGGELAAHRGLITGGTGLVRYQSVETHPASPTPWSDTPITWCWPRAARAHWPSSPTRRRSGRPRQAELLELLILQKQVAYVDYLEHD